MKEAVALAVLPRMRITLALLLVLAVPLVAAAVPGDPDRSFGSAGDVHIDFATRAGGVVVDARNRIVVALQNRGGDGRSSVYLQRYDPNGVLDPSFGADGTVLVAPDRVLGDVGTLALGADGTILLTVTIDVVTTDAQIEHAFLVFRYDDDGGVDPSFGTTGAALVTVGPDFVLQPPQLFPHPDGWLTVATLACAHRAGQDAECALRVAVFSPSGDLASHSFVFDGFQNVIDGHVARTSEGNLAFAGRAAIGADNRLVLLRLTWLGELDHSFPFNGRTVTDDVLSRFYGPVLALDGDDRFIVASSGLGMDVWRFLTDHTHDPSWQPTAIGATNGIIPADIVVQPDQRTVVVGSSHGFHGWFLAMLAPDGGPDEGFADGGSIVRESGVFGDVATAVAVEPDGRIVAAGIYEGSVVLARYLGSPRACGDADGNTILTVTDGVQVLRAAADLPSSCLADFCDTDGDGATGVTDGVLTLRAAAALAVDLRCAPH